MVPGRQSLVPGGFCSTFDISHADSYVSAFFEDTIDKSNYKLFKADNMMI